MRKDIEKALAKFQINTFGNKKNIENFEHILKSDEEILYISPTNMEIINANTRKKEKLPGICALTTKRFIFQSKILFDTKIENVSLDKIDSINCFGNSLTGSHIQIHTYTKTFDVLCSYKREIMQTVQETFEEAINNYASIDSQNISDIDEIKKYKQLLDCGAISEEEFKMKKKELLNL